MKKLLVIFIMFFLFGTILIGCKEEEDNSWLDELYELLDSIEEEMLELDQAVAVGRMERADYDLRIQTLEARSVTIQTQINNVLSRLAALENKEPVASYDEINIFLADEYYLVPGDNFQLFYRSVIQAVNPYNLHIKVVGTPGHSFNRYYEFKPEVSQDGMTYPITIEVRNDSGRLLGSASTKLIVSSLKPSESKRILCIGASATSNGQWISHGYKQYLTAGGTAHTFVGTVSTTYGGTAVKHEGRGGWQWSSFVNGYSSSVPSPFKANSGTGISFSDYCFKNGFTGIDELVCQMTYNGVGGSYRTYSMTAEPFLSAKKLVDQFHLEYPNAKVTLMSMYQPSVHSGLGSYYEINSAFGDSYGMFVTMLRYNDFLKQWADMPEYSSFVRYYDVKGQFDSEYNMPKVNKPVNNTSTTNEQIGSSMGIHPDSNGYLQMGDAFYRLLMHGWTK